MGSAASLFQMLPGSPAKPSVSLYQYVYDRSPTTLFIYLDKLFSLSFGFNAAVSIPFSPH